MKRILLLIGTGLLASGCASYMDGYVADFPDLDEIEECEGGSAHKMDIAYGDSKIVVKNRLKVKQRDVIEIKLNPDTKSDDDNVDYKDLEIRIVGKDGKSKWLNRKLKASDASNKKFRICVGDRDPDTYYYLVHVPGVGIIDPRVDVIPLQSIR